MKGFGHGTPVRADVSKASPIWRNTVDDIYQGITSSSEYCTTLMPMANIHRWMPNIIRQNGKPYTQNDYFLALSLDNPRV